MISFFTLIDYSAYAIWILISFFLSYFLVKKLGFFGGKSLVQKTLTIGLIVGHLIYLLWKKLWLFIISYFNFVDLLI